MYISDLISELLKFQALRGDLRVVLEGGYGSLADAVFWDENEDGETVLVVSS